MKKVLALHPDYNGTELLYMTTKKEVNERNKMFQSGIEIKGEGNYKAGKFIPKGYNFNAKGKFTVGTTVYAVFSDNSLNKI